MYLFLFFSIPIFSFWYLMRIKKFSFSQFIFPVILGFFISILFAFVRKFFIISNYCISYSIVSYIFHETFIWILFPAVLSFAVFFLLSKDSNQYKIDMIYALLASTFYVVLPYSVFSGFDKNSFFLLFIKPLLYIFVFLSIEFLVKQCFYYISEGNKSKLLPLIILFFIMLFMEPAIEALWYFKSLFVLQIILSVFTLVFGLFSMIKNSTR